MREIGVYVPWEERARAKARAKESGRLMVERVARAQMGKVREVRQVWPMEGARRARVKERDRGPGRDVGIVEGLTTAINAPRSRRARLMHQVEEEEVRLTGLGGYRH